MEKEKDFYKLEKNVIEIKQKIDDLQESEDPLKEDKIARLRTKIEKEWAGIAPELTPFHFVQIARHPQRPYTLDYIDALFEGFIELHGDRRAGDDPALIAGFGFYKGKTTAVIGHQKGRSTRNRLMRNFGQPNPEGYRKALRIMIQAEERGQAEAIANNLKEISLLRVPVVNIVIGEGGSGGALAVGVGDAILMLQYSFYSVISPEGCAAILWKDQGAVKQAAENLKFLAKDLKGFGIIDEIIPEPPGGAHVDYETMFKNLDKSLQKTLSRLKNKTVEEMLNERYEKFRQRNEDKQRLLLTTLRKFPF
jgi:acetyl-CoA carboxylase carboxyl transferase subunit alpha